MTRLTKNPQDLIIPVILKDDQELKDEALCRLRDFSDLILESIVTVN